MRLLALTLGILASSVFADAAVRLPFLFTHHMVLQRDAPVPVWGTAAAGEAVEVRFGDQTQETTADEAGAWSVVLNPLSVGEPRELVVTGSQSDEPWVVRDVLVGEVWVCSGQSNMQWRLSNSRDGDLEQLAADRPEIRLLEVDHLGSQQPRNDVDQAWTVCTPESAEGFSAVGYHFGTQLQETLGVPIGLIRNAWGGSACEAWTPLDRLREEPLHEPYLSQWEAIEKKHDEAALVADYTTKLAKFYQDRDVAYAAGKRLPRVPGSKNQLFQKHRPANLFNARVLPIKPFAIRGVIWYQGESNARRAYAYRDLFPRMISAWREVWGQGDFPFYWVQLADFRDETDGPVEGSDWAELREAQSMTAAAVPNSGEAVIIDLGEANDIHPRNKRDVGLRLARLALSETYGLPIKARSPRFKSMTVADGKAVLGFEEVGEKLCTHDGVAPRGFVVAGDDHVFHAGVAKLSGEGQQIVVTSPAVETPVAVRYGWADNPVVNVYDAVGLPLTPFRTDDWPGVTAPAK